MKKLFLLMLILLTVWIYSCQKEPAIPEVKVGQMWTRTDSNSIAAETVYDTLIIIRLKADYAIVDYNGWWRSERKKSLIQNIYKYERTLPFDEFAVVLRRVYYPPE